ncbi:hypothetical protein M5585_26540 [Serratia ureilytica]
MYSALYAIGKYIKVGLSCIGRRRYFSLAVYRQQSGGALAFIMMQGESSGTFDAALNPIERHNAFCLERKTEADVKGILVIHRTLIS